MLDRFSRYGTSRVKGCLTRFDSGRTPDCDTTYIKDHGLLTGDLREVPPVTYLKCGVTHCVDPSRENGFGGDDPSSSWWGDWRTI